MPEGRPVTANSPGIDDVARAMRALNIRASEQDIEFFAPLVVDALEDYRIIDAIEPDPCPPNVREFSVPEDADNPYRAWDLRLDIRGKATGTLAGIRVAVKSNIPIAGVPMPAGTRQTLQPVAASVSVK